MATYSFICQSKRHADKSTAKFTTTVHHMEGKRVDQIRCPDCGGMAKRDLVADLQTVNYTGSSPIQVNGSKFGVYHETAFAFGRFKKNPDGTEDMNHAPFRDTGELEKFVNGRNDLGPPKLDDRGRPMRRPDGSMIRTGAKMVKFSNNRRPPVNKKPRYDVPDAWVGSDVVGRTASGARPVSLHDAGVPAMKYRNPERRGK